jgi:hypothetical protein
MRVCAAGEDQVRYGAVPTGTLVMAKQERTITAAQAAELVKKYAVPAGDRDSIKFEMMQDPMYFQWQLLTHLESAMGGVSSSAFLRMVCGFKACKMLSPEHIVHGKAIVLLLDRLHAKKVALEIKRFAEANGWNYWYDGDNMAVVKPAAER